MASVKNIISYYLAIDTKSSNINKKSLDNSSIKNNNAVKNSQSGVSGSDSIKIKDSGENVSALKKSYGTGTNTSLVSTAISSYLTNSTITKSSNILNNALLASKNTLKNLLKTDTDKISTINQTTESSLFETAANTDGINTILSPSGGNSNIFKVYFQTNSNEYNSSGLFANKSTNLSYQTTGMIDYALSVYSATNTKTRSLKKIYY